HAIEGVVPELGDALHVVHDAGVVHEHVEVTELVYGALDQAFGVLELGDVACHADHRATGGRHLGGDRLDAGGVDITADDLGAPACDQERRGAALTRSCPCEDCYLAFEFHDNLLEASVRVSPASSTRPNVLSTRFMTLSRRRHAAAPRVP